MALVHNEITGLQISLPKLNVYYKNYLFLHLTLSSYHSLGEEIRILENEIRTLSGALRLNDE